MIHQAAVLERTNKPAVPKRSKLDLSRLTILFLIATSEEGARDKNSPPSMAYLDSMARETMGGDNAIAKLEEKSWIPGREGF